MFLKIFLMLSLPLSAFAFDQTHKQFDNVLKRYVTFNNKQTFVKYAELRDNSKELIAYLKTISAVKKSQFDKWPSENQLAFLINAYNAFTIKLILDHYEKNGEILTSIKKIFLFTSPWKEEFFTLFGKKSYLDQIEHEMIRQWYPKEPRIHFAVNCASIGCPSLKNYAYIGKLLDIQLTSAESDFLADTSKNSYDPITKTLKISKIFKWYGDDFAKNHTTLYKYLSTRMTSDLIHQEFIAKEKINKSFNEYDWNLNDAK